MRRLLSQLRHSARLWLRPLPGAVMGRLSREEAEHAVTAGFVVSFVAFGVLRLAIGTSDPHGIAVGVAFAVWATLGGWLAFYRYGQGRDPRRKRLLLVEDDPHVGEMMTKILEHRGWEVAYAETLADADRHLAIPPDWILLDLMLPDGGGETLLERVKRERIPTKVAVITGIGEGPRLDRVRAMGPDAVLLKPIDFEALYGTLGEGKP